MGEVGAANADGGQLSVLFFMSHNGRDLNKIHSVPADEREIQYHITRPESEPFDRLFSFRL